MAVIAQNLRAGLSLVRHTPVLSSLVILFLPIFMALATIGLAISNGLLIALVYSTLIGIFNAPSFLGRQLLIQRATPR
jgi:hypothetical protein